MTLALDQRTLVLLLSHFYLLLPVTVWLMLRMPTAPGPLLWCGGSFLGGVGFALLGLRGHISNELSYLIGQPMLVLGALLATQSLRHNLGRAWPWQAIAGPILALVALLVFLLPSADTLTLGVLIRSVNLVVMLALVHAAWCLGRAQSSRNAMTIALAFAVQVLCIVLNLSSSLAGSADLHTLEGDSINIVAYLLMALVALTVSLAYLGLALERATRTRLSWTEELARTEQWTMRQRALVQADRERLLNVVTNSLSHTMLQPLTVASLQLQMCSRSLRQAAPERGLMDAQLQQTVLAVQRANGIVEKMRELLRTAPAQMVPVDLRRVFRDLAQLLQQHALAQGTTIHYPELKAPLRVKGDLVVLTHALLQLVENALAAMAGREGSQITLRVRWESATVFLDIEDSGSGFSDAVLAGFGAEGQFSPSSLQGIGLFVVQSIMKQHHGKLSLHNSPSAGALVRLELPRWAGSSPT